MKKCGKCGKLVEDDLSLCDNCGYDLSTQKEENTKLIKVTPQHPTDLFDYPILSFVFGIFSLIFPIYIFSLLAIKLSKKPYKPSLEPMSKLGNIFGYLGILVSTLFIGYIIYRFI